MGCVGADELIRGMLRRPYDMEGSDIDCHGWLVGWLVEQLP